MTSRSLQAVFRSLVDASNLVPDADLLCRFLANDETAFAELVRRHGRLVWAACRNLTRSDAEADDAFQATFLVLIRKANTIRDAGKLSSWLHGVAYKVCAKSRQASKRRATREQATAAHEGNGHAVPDSAWDRALAAVHEEAAKLPETLRVPFVLCCLEGKSVTESAEQLGWKLGTFSGRLTRAKDAVLAKLDARGLTLGGVAAVSLAVPPAVLVAKTSALAQVGFAVPLTILQLSQGAIGMSMTSVKMLAATVLLTCGMGLSVGTGWLATADAQTAIPTKAAPTKANAEDVVKQRQAELEKARQIVLDFEAKPQSMIEFLLEETTLVAKLSNPITFKTAKWEYQLAEMNATFDAVAFATFLQARESEHWEFLGSTNLGPNGGVSEWLFRRPVNTQAGLSRVQLLDLQVRPHQQLGVRLNMPMKLDDAKSIEAEITKSIEADIAKLQAKLKELRAKGRMEFPLLPGDNGEILSQLAEKKFGKNRLVLIQTQKGIVVEGDKDVIEWAIVAVKTLRSLSEK